MAADNVLLNHIPLICVVCPLCAVDGDLAHQRDCLVVPIQDEGVIGCYNAIVPAPDILHVI
jgi:hypothetical protein